MKLTPIGERVILKPVEQSEERTKSGIYLPKSEDKKEGVVESVGTLKDGRIIPLQKGDKVLYAGYSSEEIETEGQKYLIVDFKDIIAKMGDTHSTPQQSSDSQPPQQHSSNPYQNNPGGTL